MAKRVRFSLGLVFICVGVFFLLISPLILSDGGIGLFAAIGVLFVLLGMFLRSRGR